MRAGCWVLVVAATMAACNGKEPGADRADAILALEGDPTNGQAVYEANCAVCHAESGLGEDDPTSPGVGMNLTDAAGEVEEDPEFVEIILNGKEEMTAFADILTDQEIADVLAYIHDGLIQ